MSEKEMPIYATTLEEVEISYCEAEGVICIPTSEDIIIVHTQQGQTAEELREKAAKLLMGKSVARKEVEYLIREFLN